MEIIQKEYPIKDNGFEYLGKHYDCQFAIKRDIKMILQEAETSHKDTFDEVYDRETLKPKVIRLFTDEEGKPIYGMVLYTIHNNAGEGYYRVACGGYYPFWDDKLFPHLCQESICW